MSATVNDTHLSRARTTGRSHRRSFGRTRGLVSAVAALALAAGCAAQDDSSAGTATVTEITADEFHGTLVDLPLTPAPVALRNTDGSRVRLDQLDRLEEIRPESATAVFFGFTNCHDICPTTMADLAAARRSLPAATADDVNLVFVTVDPRRDTPPVLRRWLDQFDPDIIGLRGPVARVHAAEDSLYASRSGKSAPTSAPDDAGTAHGHEPAEEGHTHPDGEPDGYGVDHSSVVYVFGPDGTTVIYTGGATPLDYTADLTRLLNADNPRAEER